MRMRRGDRGKHKRNQDKSEPKRRLFPVSQEYICASASQLEYLHPGDRSAVMRQCQVLLQKVTWSVDWDKDYE
jgi:hypothetical protein